MIEVSLLPWTENFIRNSIIPMEHEMSMKMS